MRQGGLELWSFASGVGVGRNEVLSSPPRILTVLRSATRPAPPVVAEKRAATKLSHNERTKADWPLTRGAFFCPALSPVATWSLCYAHRDLLWPSSHSS